MDQPSYIKGLNDLHDLLEDSRKGYAEAADRADDPAVKRMLSRFSTARAPLIGDLTGQRRQMDKDYEPSKGTIKGDLHRTWMEVRDALSGKENANVLSECERGEKYLLDRYDEVMKDDELPADVRQLLEKQRATVRENLANVKAERQSKDAIE